MVCALSQLKYNREHRTQLLFLRGWRQKTKQEQKKQSCWGNIVED